MFPLLAVVLRCGVAHPLDCPNGRPSAQGTGTDDLYCAVTCSGFGGIQSYCEQALVVTSPFAANVPSNGTSHVFEYYFSQPTTLGYVSMNVLYGKSMKVWIMTSSADTSDPSYVAGSPPSNTLTTVSNVATLTGDGAVKIHDPTITSKYWAVGMESIHLNETTFWRHLVLHGNEGAPIYGNWGDYSKCACRTKVQTRDCFSTQNDLCVLWPSTATGECTDCTCNQESLMQCADDKHGTFVRDECPKIFDADTSNSLLFSGTPTSQNGYWRVLFEFRENYGNGTEGARQIVHMESLHWRLTDSSNVKNISWSLYKPGDNENPTDEFRIFAGPALVQATDIEWTLAEPVPLSILMIKFEPTTSEAAQIGVKEVYVKGFIPEKYPGFNCYDYLGLDGAPTTIPEEDPETEFPLWVIFALSGCAFLIGILVCFWCFEWACFKKGTSGDDYQTSNTLRNPSSIEMQQNSSNLWNGLDQELRAEGAASNRRMQNEDTYNEDSTEESGHEMEGRTQHNINEAMEEGRPSTMLLPRIATVNAHNYNAPEGRPSATQINPLPGKTVDIYNTFLTRAKADELVTDDHSKIDVEMARILVAQFRGIGLFEVPDRDIGVKMLSGLNRRQLENKLRNLTEAGVVALEGPEREDRNRSSIDNFSLHNRRRQDTGSVHDRNMMHVAQTVHSEMSDDVAPFIGRIGRGLTQASERLPEIPIPDDPDWNREGSDRSPKVGGGVLSTQTTDNRNNPGGSPPRYKSEKKLGNVFSEEEKLDNPKPRFSDSEEGEAATGAPSRGQSVHTPPVKSYVAADELPRVIFNYKNAKRKWKPTQFKCYVSMLHWLQNNIDLQGDWVLEYTDIDGDTIQIANDDDISDALREVVNAKKSKLYITIVSSASAAPNQVAGEGM